MWAMRIKCIRVLFSFLFSTAITLTFDMDKYSVGESEGDILNTVLVTKGGVITEQILEVVLRISSEGNNGADNGKYSF